MIVPYRRERIPFSVPASAQTAIDVLGLAVPTTLLGVKFSLRRLGCGTEIWFHASGGFAWNVSYNEDVWPSSFAEARKWVAAFAARHGQVLVERKR